MYKTLLFLMYLSIMQKVRVTMFDNLVTALAIDLVVSVENCVKYLPATVTK